MHEITTDLRYSNRRPAIILRPPGDRIERGFPGGRWTRIGSVFVLEDRIEEK